MNIIILIISSEATHYNQMKQIWKKYMNIHKNITCYFIEFNEKIVNDVEMDDINNTIYIKGTETYIPGILDKTIKSIYFILSSKTIKFDYIVRTNLSTFIVLDKLYNYLLNNKFDYAGPKIGLPIKTRFKKYLNLINFDNKFYASGTCIIMSNECIRYLLEQELNYNLIDDLSIGFTLSKKYKLHNIIRSDCIIDNGKKSNYTNAINYDCKIKFLDPNKFIFRCKNIDPNNSIMILNKFTLLYYKI